ncbi:O-methyltransferase [Lindgomyces ingoldianus]|uniref:O-methyltransferase n=1 Tax=Lindgomyces ingoldianus TaxID=673940 RepID=A0ACB6RBF2_9PLEO|nr:O-methyltransferase [Lindgomyces ingoldianus]KAF2475857.1 O-methyltransferase [Lindgomyces ingoldianus]
MIAQANETLRANGTHQATGKVQAPSTSILALAQNILEVTQDMTKYFQANNLVAPTFALDSHDPPETAEYRRLHADLKTSLEDLQRLIDGPRRWLRYFCCTCYDLGALQIACDFNFFQLVPAHGEITLEELAKKAALDQDRTARVIRQLMTYRMFEELRPKVFSHSSTSLTMHQDEELRAVVHCTLDELFKASADCDISLKADPHNAHHDINPFATRHGCGPFEFYKKYPEKAVRFSNAMAGLRKMNSHIDFLLKDGFDWSAIKGTVVDVGGGNGHLSKSLAQLHPDLNFVVQDSNADMLAQGRDSLSGDLRDRVTYLQHSFFEPQPVKNAAAFLIRQVTHNWADHDVVRIFRSFVPGLENTSPNTPLLINDIILPEPGAWPRHHERTARQIDICMLVNLGAKQRTKDEFEGLLKEADARYEIRDVFDDGPLGLLVVYLKR